MSVLTDSTRRFSTFKDPREILGKSPEEKGGDKSVSLSGETEVVSLEPTTTQPRNTPIPQFIGITREQRDQNIENSILAGIEGAKDFGRGAWQWYVSGLGSNLLNGRYSKIVTKSLRPSRWYTVAFAKDIIDTGKAMTTQGKSLSYRIGTTTAAITEALVAITIAKPFLTLAESVGRLSLPILKNIGIKFIKSFVKAL